MRGHWLLVVTASDQGRASIRVARLMVSRGQAGPPLLAEAPIALKRFSVTRNDFPHGSHKLEPGGSQLVQPGPCLSNLDLAVWTRAMRGSVQRRLCSDHHRLQVIGVGPAAWSLDLGPSSNSKFVGAQKWAPLALRRSIQSVRRCNESPVWCGVTPVEHERACVLRVCMPRAGPHVSRHGGNMHAQRTRCSASAWPHHRPRLLAGDIRSACLMAPKARPPRVVLVACGCSSKGRLQRQVSHLPAVEGTCLSGSDVCALLL